MATFDSIEDLCYNVDDLSEPELVSRLKAAQIGPDVLAERTGFGNTLLHIAAEEGRSPQFCQVLHESDATLVRTQSWGGWLPIHDACRHGNVDTAIYLLEIYPKSINIATDVGMYPLHLFVQNRHIIIRIIENNINEAMKLFEFLLNHDEGAVSALSDNGDLPLHHACGTGQFTFVKALFDAHPDAILLQNNVGKNPLDLAIHYGRDSDVVQYLETQLEFRYQALDSQQLDNNGQLPIHRALQDRVASVGAIKLMITAYPASVTATDKQGCIPLHLACRYGHLDIVKYLVDRDMNSLTTLDIGGHLPLHHACLGGKLDVMNYILEESPVGVTFQNTDGKLPIELLLLYNTECDHSSMEFVDTVESLLKANPAIALANLCPELLLTQSNSSIALANLGPGLFACGE